MPQTGLALLALAAWVALRPSEDLATVAPPPTCQAGCAPVTCGAPGGFVQRALCRVRARKAILPIASSCCTEVSHHTPRRLLDRVNACRIQRADGVCDLPAVILHVKHRRLCVSPHSPTVKQWMKRQAAKKNAKGHICHMKRHHSKRDVKGYIRGHKARGHQTPS